MRTLALTLVVGLAAPGNAFAQSQLPGPQTEQDWSISLLQSRNYLARCRRGVLLSGAVAAGSLALAVTRPLTPSTADLAAGQTGKMDTFLSTLGAVTAVGAGVVVVQSMKCATDVRRDVHALEDEGRQRGYGPPQPQPFQLSRSQWLDEVASAKDFAELGRNFAIVGALMMAAGAVAMEQHAPLPDDTGPSRLGGGIGVFLAGFGVTVGGAAFWAASARDVRELEARPPTKNFAVEIAPRARGVQGRLVIVF